VVSTPILTLENVCFDYPGRNVLRGADLTLEPDGPWARVGLIGPNGSGKTTLLHVIMGLMPPLSGRVLFRGAPVQTPEELFELRTSLGFVFQDADDQLFMPTVLEDVAFGPLNLGKTPARAREISEAVLDRLGLSHLIERVTHRLSGGEKRLVALATVLAMEPRALILDEPTNDLDPDTRLRLLALLEELGLPMLVVSHDWDFLYHTVRRLVALEDGRLVERDLDVLHAHVHAHPGGGDEHAHPNGLNPDRLRTPRTDG
jgi:cobalt/nickel transport system ATP-binding protein